MKHKLVSCIALIALILFSSVFAYAEVMPMADDTISSCSITFSSSGQATFTLRAQYICSSIKVTSCVLQKKVGSSWAFAKTLTCPAAETDSYKYSESKDYSANLTGGVTYRIKATFNADGHTMTMSSSSMTY